MNDDYNEQFANILSDLMQADWTASDNGQSSLYTARIHDILIEFSVFDHISIPDTYFVNQYNIQIETIRLNDARTSNKLLNNVIKMFRKYNIDANKNNIHSIINGFTLSSFNLIMNYTIDDILNGSYHIGDKVSNKILSITILYIYKERDNMYYLLNGLPVGSQLTDKFIPSLYPIVIDLKNKVAITSGNLYDTILDNYISDMSMFSVNLDRSLLRHVDKLISINDNIADMFSECIVECLEKYSIDRKYPGYTAQTETNINFSPHLIHNRSIVYIPHVGCISGNNGVCSIRINDKNEKEILRFVIMIGFDSLDGKAIKVIIYYYNEYLKNIDKRISQPVCKSIGRFDVSTEWNKFIRDVTYTETVWDTKEMSNKHTMELRDTIMKVVDNNFLKKWEF